MTIGILLITHPGVGSALLATASRLINVCPTKIKCLDVPLDANTDALMSKANQEIEALNDGEGVLVLTDLYGATPSNVAYSLANHSHASIVSGVNLPMLMRVFNYISEDLESLTEIAVVGGIRGVQTNQVQSPGKHS